MSHHHHHDHHEHDTEKNRIEALSIFKKWLKENSLSITKSRELVANEIYSIEGHFTVDELEELLKKKEE